MSTVAAEVRACIQQDPYLRRDLARDVISHAKLARWLKKTKGLPGSEHAVISALRRMDPLDSPDPVDDARDAISNLELTVKSGMVAITFSKDDASERRVQRLLKGWECDIPLLPNDETFTIFVDREKKDDAIEKVGRDSLEQVRENLTRVKLEDPTNRVVDTQLVLSRVTEEIGLHGINIVETFTSENVLTLFVHEEDEGRALDILLEMVGEQP